MSTDEVSKLKSLKNFKLVLSVVYNISIGAFSIDYDNEIVLFVEINNIRENEKTFNEVINDIMYYFNNEFPQKYTSGDCIKLFQEYDGRTALAIMSTINLSSFEIKDDIRYIVEDPSLISYINALIDVSIKMIQLNLIPYKFGYYEFIMDDEGNDRLITKDVNINNYEINENGIFKIILEEKSNNINNSNSAIDETLNVIIDKSLNDVADNAGNFIKLKVNNSILAIDRSKLLGMFFDWRKSKLNIHLINNTIKVDCTFDLANKIIDDILR